MKRRWILAVMMALVLGATLGTGQWLLAQDDIDVPEGAELDAEAEFAEDEGGSGGNFFRQRRESDTERE